MRTPAPHCRYHDKPMRGEIQNLPKFMATSPEARNHTRKIYRCKVPGCHFCALGEQNGFKLVGHDKNYMVTM